MKKKTCFIAILFISILMLAACSNGEEAVSSDEKESTDKEQPGNQRHLVLGDTGLFATELGTYEITLNNATFLDDEPIDVKTKLEKVILLDLTIKNTSSHSLDAEKLLLSMGIVDDLDLAGEQDRSDVYTSVEHFTKEIKSGEEVTGQFITETNVADDYYFRDDAVAGVNNQVIWKVQAEQVR